MREVHPGGPQERQHRVLQAQEQPPVVGVGALDSVVELPRRISSAIPEWPDLGPNHHPLNNLSSREMTPQCPP